ncbi:MAG TPA: RNA polymerase sigma factor [Pirellulales bacterium]|jgi:RNA polymerase sigma-70 factor (ECF subfamily)
MDREAQFLELLKEGQGRWRAIARSYAGNDFEDLLQEILLQIWRSLATFRGESAGRTWCYRVAINTALNWKRSKRTRRQCLPTEEGYRSEQIPAAALSPDQVNEPPEAIHQLLAEQTPADRAILILLLDDVSYSEMAEILGASEGALRVRIHRLKERIRKRFEGRYDDI